MWVDISRRAAVQQEYAPHRSPVCRYLFTAKSLYMFRVSTAPIIRSTKSVTKASGTGHNIGTATSLRYYDLYWRLRLQFLVLLMMGAVDTRNM